jgi:hypothetical protein
MPGKPARRPWGARLPVRRLRAFTRVVAWLLVGCAAWLSATACRASSTRFCDAPAALSADQKDELFRFAGVIKTELEGSGHRMALIARSGLDLSRFGVRYSHAGLSLKANANSPWSVRQLYYACDEKRPRVFDQGISGFLLGLNDPASGYVSIVFLPETEAAALETTALDNRQALRLLAPTYSANAYAFSVSYQNCNQWVMEVLAAAWGELDDAADMRVQAQRWLQTQGYRPSVFDVGWGPLMWLATFIPWLHDDDHPADDLSRNMFRVSMPASIEAFVQATVPGARRMEFCHLGRRVVVHRGWDSIAEGCQPGEQDSVIALD